MNESAPDLGIAHFLEHMMFNGTEDYPRNDIVEALRGLGVEFGPDINAYTSYDETVYELDVVTTQEGAVETAFNVLAQWAHAATIAEADVIEERGVVRDELRLRYETGSGIINRIFDRAYTEDTPYEGYHPIGTAEVIEAMTPDMLRDFYELWYVPSNMALIAVGDLPVDELEALVQEHFGDIPAGEAPPEPDKFSPISPAPVYLIATSPSWSYSYMSLDMKIPTWEGDTVEGERARLLESLLAHMLDARLKDAYEQGFLSQVDPAKWQPFNYTDGIRFYGTNLRADDLAVALGDYWSMVLSLEADGFSAEDLQLAADVVRSDLQFELDSVGTMQDHEWAELYAAHFLSGAGHRHRGRPPGAGGGPAGRGPARGPHRALPLADERGGPDRHRRRARSLPGAHRRGDSRRRRGSRAGARARADHPDQRPHGGPRAGGSGLGGAGGGHR